jgi:serine/threonine protein kinase
MAPEQLEGHKPGPAADVYSLAAVAYEVLSGRRAYGGRTPLEIATRKASAPPPSLAEAWPGAPRAAVELLARAMGPDLHARPKTASQLVDELEAALTERPAVATEPFRPRPKPRRSWLAPLVALLVAVAVVAGVLLSSGGNEPSPKHHTTAAKKARKKSSQPAAQPQAAAPAPTPAQQPQSGYQVPVAAGNSAADGERLNTQGKALSDRGDYEAAIPVLERAVRAFPSGTTAESDLDYAFTLFNLGHALNAGGRPADAIPVLEERLKNPNQRGTVQAELDAARSAAG